MTFWAGIVYGICVTLLHSRNGNTIVYQLYFNQNFKEKINSPIEKTQWLPNTYRIQNFFADPDHNFLAHTQIKAVLLLPTCTIPIHTLILLQILFPFACLVKF